MLKSTSNQNLDKKEVSRPRPGWDTTITDQTKYKLSEKETLVKKINIMSKNAPIARQELKLRKINQINNENDVPQIAHTTEHNHTKRLFND